MTPAGQTVSPRSGAASRALMRPVASSSEASLTAAMALTGLLPQHLPAVTAGLILLGLGWSAATVAGSTLLVSSLASSQRVPAQGFSDATMSLAGALGSAAAGPVMGLIDYPGISAMAAALV